MFRSHGYKPVRPRQGSETIHDDAAPIIPRSSDIVGLNLETGQTFTYRRILDEYKEVEGIYPDEDYVLVESAKNSPTDSRSGLNNIDIYRMSLIPNTTDFVRLTNFTDTPGWKSSNPVVSPDGRIMAFQVGRSGDPPGQGRGLYLMDLEWEV